MTALLGLLPLACQRNSSSGTPAQETAVPSANSAESAAGTAQSAQPESTSSTPPPRVLVTADPEAAPPPIANESEAVEPAPASGPQRYVVAVVGDSLTDYKSHGGKFIRYLEKQCPESQFDNFGKGADMVNQMRRRFQPQVMAPGHPNYTHVIIFGGVNDLYSDLTANRKNERIERDLSQMYQWSQELGAKVVALTVSPWGGFKRYFNERRGNNTLLLNRWISDQRGGLVDSVIDTHQLLRCGDEHKLCPEYAAPFKDGLHFGPKGHEVLGKALFEQVFSDCR